MTNSLCTLFLTTSSSNTLFSLIKSAVTVSSLSTWDFKVTKLTSFVNDDVLTPAAILHQILLHN